ncbi:MAG: putative parvulin-type peptidyl-prolyl cis-trans isomerase [Steroidobacteraceae bacterium]|nr:putative parvulin-type peptidyl-prolyl cis-trans isomerase [Steroidobacteraceae bacterium]
MKSVRISAVLAAALLLVACKPGANAPAAGAATSADAKPVATVDGKAIAKSLFDTYAKGVSGKESAELTEEQRGQILDNLIRAELIASQAEKDGLAAKPETASMLELSRLNILQQEMMQKYLADKTPTEQELRAEYETQVNALSKQEYHARHILVATEDFAKRLIAQLDKGANFEQLARRESIDSSKDNGGDLGWFTPDRMVPPFSAAVVALKKGEYTKAPVQTQYGWHVIRLDDVRDVQPPPFDSVKDRLVQIVQAKKFKAYADELMKTAKVVKTP